MDYISRRDRGNSRGRDNSRRRDNSRDWRDDSMNRRDDSRNRRSDSRNRRDGSRNRRDDSRNRRSDSRNRRDCSRNRRDGSRNRRDGSRNRRDGSRNRRDDSRNRRSDSRNRRDGSRNRRDGSRNCRDGSRNRRDGSRNRRDGSRNRRDGSRNRRDGSRNRRDGSRNRRDGSRNRRDGSRNHRSVSRGRHNSRGRRDYSRGRRDYSRGRRDYSRGRSHSRNRCNNIDGSVMSLIGMCPFYDKDRNCLFYTDVFNGTINKYDFDNRKTHCFRVRGENRISFCIPCGNDQNKYVVGAGKRLLLVNWDGNDQNGKVDRVLGELNKDGVRFNNGKCDKKGRLYITTMRDEDRGDNVFDDTKRDCGLFRWTTRDGLQELKDGMGHCSGLAIDDDNRKLYFVDSCDMKIKEMDYDDNTGNVNNDRTFMDMNDFGQRRRNFPYGLTMDNDGHLYCCMNGGGKILRIRVRDHNVDKVIRINQTDNVTGCCFGGRNLDKLIITTACVDFNGNDQKRRGGNRDNSRDRGNNNRNRDDKSGFLLQVQDMGVQGKQCNRFMMN